jgi:hypothetical protein
MISDQRSIVVDTDDKNLGHKHHVKFVAGLDLCSLPLDITFKTDVVLHIINASSKVQRKLTFCQAKEKGKENCFPGSLPLKK